MLRLTLTTLLFLALATPAAAASAGRVVSLTGEVTVKATDRGERKAIEKGDPVLAGASIKTGPAASVRILMADRSVIALGPKSEFKIRAYTTDRQSKKRKKASFKLVVGRFWAKVSNVFSGERNDFSVEAANAVAGVRGTEFVVDLPENGPPEFTCLEGAVEVGLDGADPTVVGAMQRGTVGSGGLQVQAVSSEEAQNMRASVQTGTNVDSGAASAASMDLNAGATPEGADAPVTDAPGDGLEDLDDNQPPPVELDPSSGESRVRGTIKVRE